MRARMFAPSLSRFRLRLLLLAIASQTLTCGATQSEIQCEEGVSRLARCCPGFNPSRVGCELGEACSGIYPRLSVVESHCIQALDCAQLRENNVCGRILGAPGPAVCP